MGDDELRAPASEPSAANCMLALWTIWDAEPSIRQLPLYLRALVRLMDPSDPCCGAHRGARRVRVQDMCIYILIETHVDAVMASVLPV